MISPTRIAQLSNSVSSNRSAGTRRWSLVRAATLAVVAVASGSVAHATVYQWTGVTSTVWTDAGNWNANGVPVSGAHRININCGPTTAKTNEAVFNFPATTLTVGTAGDRGLVIGSGVASNYYGKLRISAGTLSTAGNPANTARDVIGNRLGSEAILELDGGNYISGASGMEMGIGGGPTSTFTINSASSTATITGLLLNATTATVNLNAGTLAVNQITGGGGTKTINFNGGTLRARVNQAAFLTGMSAVNVNSNAIIDTNGFNVTVANVLRDGGTGGGLIKNNAGTLTMTGSGASYYTGDTVINAGNLVLSPAAGIVFPSKIITTTGLQIGGAGTVELTAANTYTGDTTVTTGGLTLTGSLTSNIVVSSGANLGGEGSTTGSVDFLGTSNVLFNPGTTGATDHFRAASIDATGAVVTFVPSGTVVAGTGIVLMEAAGGITGAIGTEFQANSRLTLSYNVGNTQLLGDYAPGALVWKGEDGTNPTFWDTDTTANWFNSGDSVTDKFLAGDSVEFNDDNTLVDNPFTVNIQAPVFPGLVTFSNEFLNYTIAGQAISGGASLVKSGSGIVTLGNANSFTGTTSITNGYLVVGNAAALGGAAGATLVSGAGQLDMFGFGLGVEPISIEGSGDGTGALVSTNPTPQINAVGRLTLTGDATIGGSGRWDLRNNTPTMDMGGFTLTKVGTNTIAMVGATITNPGNIEVLEGTLGSHLAASLDGGDTHTLTVGAGALYNNYQTTGAQNWKMVLQNGGSFWAENSAAATHNTWSGPVQIENSGTGIFQAQGAMTVSGVISGIGSELSKTGASTLTLSNANTYTGPTTVNAGSIIVQNASALGTSTSGTTVLAGHVGVDAGVVVAGEAITISGQGTNFFGALQGNSGVSEWQGNVNIAAVGARIGVNAGEFTVSGVIDSGGQPYGLTLRPNTTSVTVPVSTLIISGANTYLGDTGIVSGTGVVKLAGGNDRLPVTTTLLFGIAGGGNQVPGILDLNGQNQSVAGITTVSANTNEIRSATTALLTVTSASTSVFAGVVSGQVSLTNTAAGALVLRGANTTAGDITAALGSEVALSVAVAATTQTGGVTLTAASNVISVTSTVGLVPGQVVTATGGTGTMPGNSVITSIIDGTSFTINNTVVTGGSPASITFGALNAGSLTFYPAANGVSNKVTGAGTANIDGTFNIDLTGAAIADGNEWTLIDATTTEFDSGTFAVTGFTESPEGTWTKVDGGRTWTFTESTGKLQLATAGGYSQWAIDNGVTLGETGDDDKDGITNLIEYALGLDPQVADGPQGTFVGNLLTFTKGDEAKLALDVDYFIETSTTLQSGSWTPAAATDAPDSISYLLPSNEPGGKIFGRLKVIKP